MLAGRCRGGWCGDERNDLFVGVYLEPSLTDCLIHGGDELVAALVLDWGAWPTLSLKIFSRVLRSESHIVCAMEGLDAISAWVFLSFFMNSMAPCIRVSTRFFSWEYRTRGLAAPIRRGRFV